MITDFFFACYWRIQLGEYAVSIRWCHMPHNSSEYGFITRDICWPCNFSSWWSQMATKIMRFDTNRLFSWGYANDRVFADKRTTLEHLKTNKIPPNMCQNVIENYLKRINACNTSRGYRLNDAVFHT